MTFKQLFTSSIGKKFVMSLTGIFLITFLVIHVGLNACIWAMDNGEMFNKGAHFMGTTVLVRILEVGLFIGFFIHIIQGYVLTAQNLKRRAVGYQVQMGNKGSAWYSRWMGLLGTLLLLFLVMHIYHFWTPSRLGGIGNIHELAEAQYNGGAVTIHDLYREMKIVFQNPIVVAVYVAGCISLSYHLMHGFQSAFRTLGLGNRKWLMVVQTSGLLYAIIVPLGFAMMPVSMYFGWVN